MANKSRPADDKSPTNDFIDKCKKDLCDEKVTANSKSEACCTEMESNAQDRQYKICCLVTSQKANQFYQNFKFCTGQPAVKISEKSKEKVAELIEKEKELHKKFKELTKMIKESRDKMKIAVECACGLERCFDEEERCNPDVLNALETGIDGFSGKVLQCKTETETCYEKLNQAFDSAINISGILTFSDVDSLAQPVEGLNEKVKALATNYDAMIDSTGKKVAADTTALTECIDTQQAKKIDCCFITADKNALTSLYDFVCDPACADKDLDRIKEVCKKFVDVIPEEEQSDECDEEAIPKARNPEQIRENRKM